MSAQQIEIGMINAKIAELEDFKEMVLKEHPDLSTKFEEIKKKRKEENCAIIKGFCIFLAVLAVLFILMEIL